MKKGTIMKNLWAGNEKYIVYRGPTWSAKNEAAKSNFYQITNVEGKWRFDDRAQYYNQDFQRDREHFPIVGRVDLEAVVTDAILKAISEGDEENVSAD